MKISHTFLVALCAVVPLTAIAQSNGQLTRYTKCKLGKDFQIVQVDRLPHTMTRGVKTKSGDQEVVLLDGYRVLITYDQTEPFVNLKVEQLQKSTYATDKQTLIDTLEFAASGTPNMESSTPKKEVMNGIELYSVNRKHLEGGSLSIYNLFSDADQIAVTMYLLNDEPAERKFQSIEQCHDIRDSFLRAYTSCVRELH